MKINKEDVCIFIPCLNEAPTIDGLIKEFKKLGFNDILIMDGHSNDGTPDIARKLGVTVRTQTGRGKGNAIIEAIDLISKPYVVMLDGDGTYLPKDAEKMMRPLSLGFDHVIGDRLINAEKGAFKWLNRTGNNIINLMFKFAHSRDLHDILSGYRAFTLDSIRQLNLKEEGFEIETEISAECVRNGQRIMVVPIRYLKRPGTATKLSPFHDGFKIIRTIIRLAKINNPMFYFGMIGVVLMIAGLISGLYVTYEWFQNIEHIPFTILTVLLLTLGFMIFMFGIISDMILVFHREIQREIQDLKPPKKP